MKTLFFSIIFLCGSLCVFAQKDSCVLKFQKIAEEFNPIYTEGDSSKIPDVPIFTKQERRIIIKAYETNKKEAQKYVMLILLKVYKAQLNCCKMGYNLADNGFSKDYNTIVYLFIKMTNFCKIESEMECSYISSAIPYNLTNNNPDFLMYKPIKKEIEEIENLDKRR